MENFNFINYHRTRDFSRKMNATFEFIRQNFKGLFRSILFIAGPPILIASLLMASFMGDFMNFSQTSMQGGNPDVVLEHFMSVSFWLQIAVMIIFFMVSSVMTLATVNNYIILYEEKQTNKIEVTDVWERVRNTFWMYTGTIFLFVLAYVLVIIVIAIPFALFAVISPVLIVFGGFIFMGLLIYLIFSVSLTFFIRAYEKTDFVDSVVRSFKLVQGKWWSTFGLLLILYMIVSFASTIFYIPAYVLTMIQMLHNLDTGLVQEPSFMVEILTTVFMTLYYLIQMIMNALPNIGIAFQYFNLVELKEAKGLITSIESFGQDQPPATPQDEHY